MPSKKDIRNISIDELEHFLKACGEPTFRAKQIYQWLWKKNALSFDEMTNISKDLRDVLDNHFVINHIQVDKIQKSSDGTIKNAVKLHDDHTVESVLIPTDDRTTACVSSQVGCAVDCDFCATGKMGFKKNLSAGEIIDQLLLIQDDINTPITNIVFMGMGEPFLNYNNVIKAAHLMNDKHGLNFSYHRITISTSGILPKINQFINDQLKYNLAISLNASDNETRNKLIPINKKWPIKELLSSLEVYPGVNNSRRITFEYIMLDGVNDSINDAKKLVKLLKPIHAKVNLIPFNPWPGSIYRCSSYKTIRDFADEVCYNGGITATVRHARGQDILAACGQLKSNSVRLSKEKVVKINAA